MARLSPITLSLAAIMVAVLSGAVFLFVHARQLRPETVKDLEPVAAPAPPPPARAPEPEPLPPPPPVAPAVALVDTPAEADAQALAEDQPPLAPNRRGLLMVNHNRRMQEADENVFASLALPESTRASIRQINDAYRRRTEPGDASVAGTAASAGDEQAALKARQDALTSLLGTDSVKSFDSEERIAVMKLRGKYRYEWGRQLRQ